DRAARRPLRQSEWRSSKRGWGRPMDSSSAAVIETSHSCSIKLLPQNSWIQAATKAAEINPANAPARQMMMQGMASNVIQPMHLALLTAKYWGRSSVNLTVGFLDNPPADLRARIISHMNAWNTVAHANVKFVETATDPQVRIARTPGEGYWSYLGTDILSI